MADSIETLIGVLPLDSLVKKVLTFDESEATLTATEYWYDGQLVRRDVNVALKPKDILSFTAEEFNHG